MDRDLKQYLDDVEVRLKAHAGEECENVQTKLLAEFWKWGRGNDRVFTLERKAAGSKE